MNLLRSALFATGVVAVPAAALAQTVAIATLPPGAITNAQGQVLAKVLQDNTDLKVRITPMRGGAPQMAAVNAGRAQFSLWGVDGMTPAVQGKHQYDGRKLPKLRLVAPLIAFPIGIFVKKDSDIKSITDLKGKRYPVGWVAQPGGIAQSQALLASVGMSEKDVTGVPVSNVITGADDFKAGKTDAAVFAVGAPKVAEVAAAVGGIRFLPIDNSPAAVKRMTDIRIDFYPMTVPPLPHFVGVEKPTPVLGIDIALITSEDVPEETVYKVIKAIYANKTDLAKGHPTFRAFDPKKAAKQFAVARYHPGAIKYFKEVNLWPGK